MSAIYAMHDWLYLRRPQPLSIFVPPVSGLPLMVGRSTNQKQVATHALTSVVFTPGRQRYTWAVALTTCFMHEISQIYSLCGHKYVLT